MTVRRGPTRLRPAVRLGLLGVLALASCGTPPDAPGTGGAHIPTRIASLACNGTDILLALGQRDRMVAVEEDCPCPGTETLVKIRNEDHPGKMAAFSVETLLALHPDAVIAHPDLQTALEGRGIPVVWTLEAQTYENIPDLVDKIGVLLDMRKETDALLDHMRAKADEIRRKTAGLPRVVVYFETLGIGGTSGRGSVMDAMIEMAGGINIAHDVPKTRATITQEAIFAADPEVLILGPWAETEAEVLARPGWDRIRAVRNHRIYRILPERRNVAQGTPRCVDECEALLLPWLHPEVAAPATNH
jgi:iron complex transport system substrate-binding protein